MSKINLGKISSAFRHEYHGEIVKQLNLDSIFTRIVKEENERKEKIIRESLESWRLWLVDRIKWRRAKKWLVRDFLIMEEVVKDNRVMSVYKGDRLLRQETIPLGPELRFVRHRFQGGD